MKPLTAAPTAPVQASRRVSSLTTTPLIACTWPDVTPADHATRRPTVVPRTRAALSGMALLIDRPFTIALFTSPLDATTLLQVREKAICVPMPAACVTALLMARGAWPSRLMVADAAVVLLMLLGAARRRLTAATIEITLAIGRVCVTLLFVLGVDSPTQPTALCLPSVRARAVLMPLVALMVRPATLRLFRLVAWLTPLVNAFAVVRLRAAPVTIRMVLASGRTMPPGRLMVIVLAIVLVTLRWSASRRTIVATWLPVQARVRLRSGTPTIAAE